VSDAQQIQAVVDHAIRLHQAGRVVEAEKIYREVLRREPNQPDALHLLGLIAHHVGHAGAAELLMRRAIGVAPGVPLYHLNLAKVYRGAGHPTEALASVDRAVALDARFAEAHIERSACLLALRRPSEAEIAARRAVSLRPSDPQALGALGNALAEQGRMDQAIIEYRAALEEHPQHAETLNNLGESLRKVGQYEEAERHLRESVRLAPQVGDGHFNLSLLLLAHGRLEEGWAEYEWRWRQIGVHPPRFEQPAWDGAPLDGKSILLYGEQGLGDVIQFVRYAPLVQRERRARKVIVQCQPALMSLVKTVEGVAAVIAGDTPAEAMPAFDVHCALASLPHRFGTTIETIPNQCPYVSADSAHVRAWRERLKLTSDVRNIGLVWAGSATHRNDRNRSCRLADLAPLAKIRGVRWFSLQLGDAAQQLASSPAGMTIEDPTDGLRDFADTAALMEALDLTITVDTAPAHLAGALARPVWVMLPSVPDFRWLLDRGDSPWYPAMRLFRQRSAGDWSGVMLEVVQALDRDGAAPSVGRAAGP
jgi:tetratricopeptide (TPR) repeat protein